MIPYSKRHPYQNSLAECLGKRGVKVCFATVYYPFAMLISVLFNWKIDLIHLHWVNAFPATGKNRFFAFCRVLNFIPQFFFICLWKILGVKLVWTVHNLRSHERYFQGVELAYRKILARMSDGMIAHSQYAKDQIKSLYGIGEKKIRVIFNGNLNYYRRHSFDKKKIRAELSIKEGEKVFLCIGRVRPYKGIPDFVKAFKRTALSDAKLFVVGKPVNNKAKDHILEMIGENININTIFDFVDERAIAKYMTASDVLVLPYKDILTSGAIMLALAYGKAVIAPDIGAITEYVAQKGAFLYEMNGEGLEVAIKKAMNSDLEAAGKHNLDHSGRFDWDKIAKETYELYRESLESKS